MSLLDWFRLNKRWWKVRFDRNNKAWTSSVPDGLLLSSSRKWIQCYPYTWEIYMSVEAKSSFEAELIASNRLLEFMETEEYNQFYKSAVQYEEDMKLYKEFLKKREINENK